MKYLILLLAFVFIAEAYKSSNPLKTKKYKCVEVADDEEIQIVKKKKFLTSKYPWKAEEEKAARKSEAMISAETIEMPMARKVLTKKILAATTPATVSDVQRDSKGRPLILSPQHCKQIEHYSKTYGVKDVLGWVQSNCAFAKMYVPGATCEEINILVASCYKKN
ncbi:unnamed protein product [Caenorhabditis bovis]|uniref:aECM cysteine-cradle domain-containing protein n=1 Tax=Caenorhabditis bovis TaxID=2654633 RepID=A0A8S1F8Y0_9PELO|nr:unnamed protein product [Caenorhabditis bovis]